jgi:DNA-directed RNA polymerase specialized sigma24 family protein
MTTSRASADGFARLLAWFAEDEAAAQDRLNTVQRDLALFFRKRGVVPEDVDDLVQDVVMTAASKCRLDLPPYPTPEPLMFGIARMVRLQYFRRQSSKREVELPDGLLDRAQDPVDRSPEAECLQQVLKALAPRERALLVEYYGGNNRDRVRLAQALEIASPALRVRVFRLKQRVSERIGDCLKPLPPP